MRLLLILVTGVLTACGSDSTPAPTCSGSSCACPPNTSCDIGNSGCAGDSCSLACSSGNTCTGTCGDSCSISCAGMSDCDVTVGASASVGCTGGSTCTVRCTGSCSVSCSADSTCMLQCTGDTAPHSITTGGTCS